MIFAKVLLKGGMPNNVIAFADLRIDQFYPKVLY
jgi:hypothetical protein